MNEQKPTSETREPITSGTRSNNVDIVKGIAITLVVYGHTVQGMIHRGWWVGAGATFSNDFIYSFHMPAFFFVSGLFVMSSLAKRGSQHFAVDKMKTILYPYLLFAIIGVTIEPLIGRFKYVTRPFHWNAFLTSVADGDAGWFLFVLFLCLMLALVTARVPAWLRFLAAVLAALLPLHGPSFVHQLLHEFCFLAAGMWVGTHIFRMERMRAAPAALGFVLLAAFQAAMVYTLGAAALFLWPYIVFGLTGTPGLFLLAKLLDRHPIGNAIAWVGRGSLAVYFLSALAQGAARAGLPRGVHTREVPLYVPGAALFTPVLPP